jgi:hypothetical protein
MNIKDGLNVPLSQNMNPGGVQSDKDSEAAPMMYNFGQIDPSLMPFFNIAESKVNKPNFEKAVCYEKEVSLAKKAYEVFLSFLKEISFEKEMIEQRVRHYENIYHKIEKTVRPRKKNRRTSSAIIRNYVVPFLTLPKSPIPLFPPQTPTKKFPKVPLPELPQKIRVRRIPESAHQAQAQRWQ